MTAIKENVAPFQYGDAFEVYKRFAQIGEHPSLMLESRAASKSVARSYDKNNLMAATQALKVTGKNDHFRIEALSDVGIELLRFFVKDDFPYARDVKVGENCIEGSVEKNFDPDITEFERVNLPNMSYVIRTVLSKFKPHINYRFAGLYGAFAYDFARNFVDFGNRFAEGGSNDFTLFLPSNIVHLDNENKMAEHFQLEVNSKKDELKYGGLSKFSPLEFREYEDMTLEDYARNVERIVDEIKKGRLMQCVLSRNYGQSLQMHSLDSYSQLREKNPSPYSFFFDFLNGEFLYGASPELHVKVNGSELEIRPIAGTIRKGSELEQFIDIENKKLVTEPRVLGQYLKQIEKELAEHSMLVDLGRNDVCLLSVPGSMRVTDFLTVEEYPNLYHIVSGVKGTLREGVDSVHALLTTLPAGTLSGAPKREAMKLIEELEVSRRDYYGGAIGYFAFNGDCNTGITIRSVHVKDGMSYVRSGAGIVLDSDPQSEVVEIQKKSEMARRVLRKQG